MGTIVTVHGTFASGEPKGERWWQTGSTFERDLKQLVQAKDGTPIVVEPLIWDGMNSEASRRAAGARLADRMRALEKAGAPYAVVGHSHGGSVILAAILRCAAKGVRLSGLSRWITVGTPFIAFAPKRGLFSRLGLSGRAVYMSVLTFLVMLAGLVVARDPGGSQGAVIGALLTLFFGLVGYRVLSWASHRDLLRSGGTLPMEDRETLIWPRFGLVLGMIHATVLVAVLMIATSALYPNATFTPAQGALVCAGTLVGAGLLHLALAWLNRRFAREAARRRAAVLSPAMSAAVGFRHRHDEAIAGLSRIHEVGFQIFGRDIIVAQFMFAAVLAFPVLLLGIVTSPSAMRWLSAQFDEWVGIGGVMLVGDGQVFAENVRYLNKAMSAVLRSLLLPGGTGPSDLWFALDLLLSLVLIPIAFVGVSAVVVALARMVGQSVSGVLSRILDRVAWTQIRASVFGSDLQGERAIHARTEPAAAVALHAPLPDELGDEISAVSDAASAKAIAKLRIAIADLAFSGEGRGKSDVVSDYLSWDELIHTAYFKVPRFNKLLAYAIATSPGFEPTAQFRADSDHEAVARWYGEITAGKEKAPAGA